MKQAMQIVHSFFSVFLILSLVSGTFFFDIPKADAQSWYVKSSGSDSDDGQSKEESFETLKRALNDNTSLDTGDKISLEGSITECGPFEIDADFIERLTIEGESSGSSKIKIRTDASCTTKDELTAFKIIDGASNDNDGEIDLEIKNIEFEGFRYGIYKDTSTILKEIKITNVDFDGIGNDDINAGSCNIDGTNITEGVDSFTIDNGASVSTTDDIIITASNPGTSNISVVISSPTSANDTNTSINDSTISITRSSNTVTIAIANDADGNFNVSTRDIVSALLLSADGTLSDDTTVDTILDGVSVLFSASGGDITTAVADSTGSSTNNGGDGAGIFLLNVEALTISQAVFEQGTHGVFVKNENNNDLVDISITGLELNNMDHSGVTIIGTGSGDGITVSGIIVDEPAGCGLILKNIDDSSTDIKNITILSPAQHGVFAENIIDINFDNITISESEEDSFVVQGSDNNGVELNDITITKSEARGIFIDSSDEGKITESSVSESEEEGISIIDSEDFILRDNSIFKNKKEGVILDGNSNDAEIYGNIVYENEEYGLAIDSSVEGGDIYSNQFYKNDGDDDIQVQDSSDDEEGIDWYFEDADSPYSVGGYYAPFISEDTDFNGVSDKGYLPEDKDDEFLNGKYEFGDRYARLTSGRVAENMKPEKIFTKINVPYDIKLAESDIELEKVQACIREVGSDTAYDCTEDTDTVTPIPSVSVTAGKSYDVIVIAQDALGNRERLPVAADTAEFIVAISSNASGTEPAPDRVSSSSSSTSTTSTVQPIVVSSNDPPTVVVDISVQPASASEILVTWSGNNPDQGVTEYHVYRSAGDSFTKIATVDAPGTKYVDNNLSSSTTYSYYVIAKNNIGTSSQPDTISTNPGNPSINQAATSNIVRNVVTNTTVARSLDALASFIATPKFVSEATGNNAYSIVTQIERNDSANVASVFPLNDTRYQFVGQQSYKISVSNLNSDVSVQTFDDSAVVEIRYTNDDVGFISEDNLTIAVYNDVSNAWMPLFTTINSNANTARAKTRQVGFFAIIAHEAPRSYEDVFSTSPFVGYIGSLTRSGITSGNGGRFMGNMPATRAELIKMKIRAEGYLVPTFVTSSPCPDGSNDAFAPYFQVALDQGIINGYSDGTCKPDNYVTRQEALKIILGEDGKDFIGSISFGDFDSIAEWAKSYVSYAQRNDVVGGFSDNTFRPQQNVSRNEISKMLYQAVSKSY